MADQQQRSKDGWPVDDEGKRTDPIGRYLDSLTPDQRRAWGATCGDALPRISFFEDGFKVIYPWERDQP